VNYEPLHHKYRPQTFADLVGQEAIAATLTNAITSKRIAPAYLFTGSRGTGKTSSARILAKSLNCLASKEPTPNPCGKCDVCRGITSGVAMDVIEIDAASNTGVDNIREIIEKSHFAPVQCRYKVYAIDEVHGLTNQAFNALLKTLEEPPERVVFILATTDPQRVLPTIISRCQRFDFRRIPLEAMVNHLIWIAQQEQIQITQEAVRLVAQISQGGLRDAESLLDQLSLLKDGVTAEKVWDLVGAVSEIDLLAMVQAIAEGDPETIINRARNLMDRGKEPMIVLQNLAGFYRDLLIAKTAPKSQSLVALTPNTWQQLLQETQRWTSTKILAGSKYLRDSETQIKHTTQPRLWLEVTLLGLLLPDQSEAMPLVAAQNFNSSNNGHNGQSAINQPANGQTQNGYGNGSSNGHNNHSPTPSDIPFQVSQSGSQLSNTAGSVGAQGFAPSSDQFAPSPNQFAPSTDQSAPSPNQFAPSTQPEIPSQVTAEIPEPEIDEMLETWQEVVDHIAMYSTQVFLKQHCQLLEFDGIAAVIGVTNENLINTARRKKEEIEAAFNKLCGRKVAVQLEVAGKRDTPRTSSPSVQENGNGYSNGSNQNSSSSTLNNDPSSSSNGSNGFNNGNNNGNPKELTPSYSSKGNGYSNNGNGNNGYSSNGNTSNGSGISSDRNNNGQALELNTGSVATLSTELRNNMAPAAPLNYQPSLIPTVSTIPERRPENTLDPTLLAPESSTPEISLDQELPSLESENMIALKQISNFFEGEIINLDGIF